MKFKKECERKAYEKAKAAYDEFIKVYPFTTDDLPGEIWRPIPDYENYHGSNFGRVKRFYKYRAPKILKPYINRFGYLFVSLFKDDKYKVFRINRLVAMLFIPNPENKPEVNHKFGIKFDNYFENLEWATSIENQRHAYDTGLQAQGLENYNAKIKSEEDIVYIRENPDGLTGKALAEMFGVSKSIISRIQLGVTYKNEGGAIRKKHGVTDEDKEKILAKYRRGVRGCGQEALAKEFGYNPTTIRNLVKNQDNGGTQSLLNNRRE